MSEIPGYVVHQQLVIPFSNLASSSASPTTLEPEQPRSPSPRAKRRLSSSSVDASSKRSKLSENISADPATTIESPLPAQSPKEAAPENASPGKVEAEELVDEKRIPDEDRKKSSVVEEKKRGRRLFGGLLSALSQTTPVGQQKRRFEIEQRQAEKAKEQRRDDQLQKAERLAKIKQTRRDEQVKYDETSVSRPHEARSRHC